jgi:hypothetical protein
MNDHIPARMFRQGVFALRAKIDRDSNDRLNPAQQAASQMRFRSSAVVSL